MVGISDFKSFSVNTEGGKTCATRTHAGNGLLVSLNASFVFLTKPTQPLMKSAALAMPIAIPTKKKRLK